MSEQQINLTTNKKRKISQNQPLDESVEMKVRKTELTTSPGLATTPSTTKSYGTALLKRQPNIQKSGEKIWKKPSTEEKLNTQPLENSTRSQDEEEWLEQCNDSISRKPGEIESLDEKSQESIENEEKTQEEEPLSMEEEEMSATVAKKKGKVLAVDRNNVKTKRIKFATVKKMKPELLGTRVWRWSDKKKQVYSAIQRTDKSGERDANYFVDGTFRFEPKVGGKTLEQIARPQIGYISKQDSDHYGKYFSKMVYRDAPAYSVKGTFKFLDEAEFNKLIQIQGEEVDIATPSF